MKAVNFVKTMFALVALTLSTSGYGFSALDSVIGPKIPQEVLKEIDEVAVEKCGNDSIMRERFIEREKAAYYKMIKMEFETPIEKQIEISKRSKEKFKTYEERLVYVDEQNNACSHVLRRIRLVGDEKGSKIKEINDKFYKDDYVLQSKNIQYWESLLDQNSRSMDTTPEEFKAILSYVIERSDGKAEQANLMVSRLSYAKVRIRTGNFKNGKISDAEVNEIKAEAAKKFPMEYELQLQYITEETAKTARLVIPEHFIEIAKKTMESCFLKEVSDPKIISKGVNASVYRDAGADKKTIAGILCNIDGTIVILAHRRFIPENLPVTLTNSIGAIRCSKSLASNSRKIIALVPDSIPEQFVPLELSKVPVTENESMFVMQASSQAVAISECVYTSSTSTGLMNFSYKYNDRTIDINNRQRYMFANLTNSRMAQTIAEEYDNRTTPIILNAKGELVAYSIEEILTPSNMMLEAGLRCSFEEVSKRGYSDSIRAFTARVGLVDRNTSIVTFVNPNELKEWTTIDFSKYKKQEDFIRKYTRDAIDALSWISEDSYGNAKTTNLLSGIANRYSNKLENSYGKATTSMNRKSFEEAYLAYYGNCCFEINNLLKKQSLINMTDFYFFDRDFISMQFQIVKYAYQRATERYDQNRSIMPILHKDLKQSYNRLQKN